MPSAVWSEKPGPLFKLFNWIGSSNKITIKKICIADWKAKFSRECHQRISCCLLSLDFLMRCIRLILVHCLCHHTVLIGCACSVNIISIRKKLHSSFRNRRRNLLHRTSGSYLYNLFPYYLFKNLIWGNLFRKLNQNSTFHSLF